ncbi:MAG TPA: helix-turn-helix transcriptional regulator [Flavobacterium sp.]|nr:helix-turn-helix transcriptional regulator [Flavobacterium sp.]
MKKNEKASKPIDPLVAKLAARIKQLRKDAGYSSFEDFANDRGVIHRAQLGRYEKGQDLRYTSLVKVAKMFDMTLSEFFSEGFN